MAQHDNISSIRYRFSASTSSFLSQFGGGGTCSLGGGAEQEMDIIMLDHGYSKPWSAHPDASNARPLRMLFMPKQIRPSTLDILHGHDPPIDVVEAPPAPSMPFDINKARNLMTECERHASYARPDCQEDWEDKISKQGWTIQQNRVFTKVIKALQADRLARLAMDAVPNEPIARRQLVDKTAKRLRQALASIEWDMNVVQWLHQLILDTVSIHLLASYLDALQTLKSKLPTLVDKMVSGAPPKHPSLSQESLGLLLKRPWDPVNSVLMQHKLRKLPNNPLLLLAPSGPTQGGSSSSGQAKRLKFWQAHLNTLGKTITVNMSGGSGVSMVLCMEQMIGALRTKVLEQKSHVHNRPIVLVGWNVGALVACHVSLVESVSAVVCLGFPFTGVHGPRGDCEDPLLASQTPTLFVVGQNASDCSVDQLQDLREHMRAETGMLVVGGADEQLRLSHRKKREEGLTQAMADRWIIEEVNQFLGSILSMNAGSPEQLPAEVVQIDPRKKRKRKVADLIGADNNLPSALNTGSAASTTRVVASGTGRVSKRGGKAARQTAASGESERGRAPAPTKRRQGRGGSMGVGVRGARKRVTLGVGVRGARSSAAAANLQAAAAANAATLSAVSSAPELYGLLQGFPIGRPREGGSGGVGGNGGDSPVLLGGTSSVGGSAISGARSLMGASFPRTKLLAFSKLKEEGGAGVVGEAGGGGLRTTGVIPATVLASALRGSGGGGGGDAGGLSGLDKDKLVQQQQQILVRTGGSASSSSGAGAHHHHHHHPPITIPLSMTSRLVAAGNVGTGLVGVTSPLVHITGSGGVGGTTAASSPGPPTSSSHIHQLLTTSMARITTTTSSSTITTAAASQAAALLINTMAAVASSSSSSSSALNGGGGEKGDVELITKKKLLLGEKLLSEVVLGQAGSVSKESVLASLHSSQYHDFPLTTASFTNPATVLTQGTLTGNPGGAASLTQQVSLSHPQGTAATTVLIQAKSAGEGGSRAGSPATLPKPSPSVMQLAVTKSLINAGGSGTVGVGSSILGKVVAGVGVVGQPAGQAGSPIATSSILGGRNTVLLSTKCLSSSATTSAAAAAATLLGKAAGDAGGSPSSVPSSSSSTSYVLNTRDMMMLGKVSSVLEPSTASSLRRVAQALPQQQVPPGGSSGSASASASLIASGSFSSSSLTKTSIINALSAAGKLPPSTSASTPSAFAGQGPSAMGGSGPVPMATAFAPASAPASAGGAGSTSGGTGGRGGGHKSATAVSYASNAKPVLPTVASTRTRRIRTPKQYDL